ncbi:MAG: methionine--tRNA ligase [Rickettsiales bacterium]|nr:methionine--tRNA ligase [Rickettsiales bacterium]
MKPFYITTPIYYVNSTPTVGAAYTTMFADILARFYKMDSYNVKFLTGTDEHGQKIEQSAKKNNEKEQEFVDRISLRFRDLIKLMDYQPTQFEILNDSFIRTTMPCHKAFVQDVWRVMVKNDWIYEGVYSGWYCVSDEAYYDESELIKGQDGILRTELGSKAEWREEKTYFFRLSEFQDLLLKIYKEYPNIVQPYGKKTEVLSFISGLNMKDYDAGIPAKKDYLKDLSVSRNGFDWGIRIPCDLKGNELLNENGEWKKDVPQSEKHVIYVWFDALFNYLTALGCKTNHSDYKDFWLNNPNKYHLIGKEILRPHAVYWPSFLIAFNYTREQVKNMKEVEENIRNILPTTIYAHGWLTNEGVKMSKSLGNGVYAETEIEWLKTEYNLNEDTARDYFKYYLLTLTTFGNDGDYSRLKLIEKVNSDLANKIGNLAKRTLDMIYKNCDAKIPQVKKFDVINSTDISIFENCMKNFDFTGYVENLIKIADETNKYMDEKAPWKLKKEGEIEEMNEVLYSIVNMIRKIAILLKPLCPYLSNKILSEIGFNGDILFNELNKNISGGQNILEPSVIVPRLSNK